MSDVRKVFYSYGNHLEYIYTHVSLILNSTLAVSICPSGSLIKEIIRKKREAVLLLQYGRIIQYS